MSYRSKIFCSFRHVFASASPPKRGGDMLNYKVFRVISAASIIAMVSGCGGGGGGGGSSSGGDVVTITPTPTPTPLPTPAPTPTGSIFSVGAGAAIIGTATFDTNKNGIFGDVIRSDGTVFRDVYVYSNTSGQFGPVTIDGNDGKELTVNPTEPLQAVGLDMLTGYYLAYLSAPKGATNLSPVTTLLRSLDDDLVASNTGLSLSARDISSFAAVAAMSSTDADTAALGRRVTSYNLKLSALAMLSRPSQEAVVPDAGIVFDALQATIGEQLKLGRVDLNNALTIASLLDRMPLTIRYASPEARRAISDLLARYGAAVDQYLTEPRRAADVQHGFRLVVLPTILDVLMRRNSASDADSITTDALLTAFREFAEIPAPKIETRPYSYLPVSVLHSLVAVTDLRSIDRLALNGIVTLRADCSLGNDYYSPPFCNDAGVSNSGFVGIDRTELRVTNIRVPDEFSARLSVSLAPNGEITLRRLNGTVGLVWFEYDVAHAGGLTATGRTFVRLGLSN